MKREKKIQWRKRLLSGVLALGMVLMLALTVDSLGMISRADGQVRVIVNSGARIRAEANTSSAQVGSVAYGTTLSVISQVQGSDGKTWYQVQVNADTRGYIRGDLVEQVSGGTTATNPPAATNTPEPPVEVTEVNPVSATVEGGTTIRVRSNASNNAESLATVSSGLAVTVIGQAHDAEGKLWYKVNFIHSDAQINGFIRSDFVKLAGELTPVTPAGSDTPAPPVTTAPPDTSAEQKEYDTILAKNGWMLYRTADPNNGWVIKDLLDGGELGKTVKAQKIAIIILVILLVGVIAGASYLIFKLKDMADSAYFNQVESETLRKRSAATTQGGSQRVMHTVGTDKSTASRPAGSQGQQRPAGSQSQRPAGSQSQQRPAGSQGQQRPAGSQGQQRPVSQGQQRPVGSQGQNPAAGAQGQKPAGSSRTDAAKPQQKEAQPTQGWKSKNFMADEDDEFEFSYLNVDNNDEKK